MFLSPVVGGGAEARPQDPDIQSYEREMSVIPPGEAIYGTCAAPSRHMARTALGHTDPDPSVVIQLLTAVLE